MIIRNIIPQRIRLNLKLFQRNITDLRLSVSFAKDVCNQSYPYYIEEQQIIKPSLFFENKIHNLRLGASYIEDIVINSNQILSFWNRIGKPTLKRGFKEGRNLIVGKLCSDVGGGLCQLSGIMYLTALKAGLKIVERHNHSVDIYKEENERFAPLGSDATIVFGYKDLRIQNPYDFPIKFSFEITSDFIRCRLLATKIIEPRKVSFVKTDKCNLVKISTFVDDKFITFSFYKRNF